jgi:hypothetical protein
MSFDFLGFGGPSYGPQQPYVQQRGYPQQQGMFGSMFGSSERLNQQTIQQIMLQLQQQRISPESLAEIQKVLNDMVLEGTEKVNNVLKQYISPELSSIVINKVSLEQLGDDIEDDIEGVPSGQRMGTQRMGPQRMGPQRMRATGYPGSLGYSPPPYIGGKKRRTRGRKQRGGNNVAPADVNSLATNAEGFRGGRRKKTHRKH